MPKTESYTEGLQERLRDGQHAAEYLKACLADDDPGVFLLGLRDVADAHGGIRQVSEKTNLNRENLYRMLSKAGNPSLQALGSVLESLGLKLSVEVKTPRKPERKVTSAPVGRRRSR